MPGYRGPDKPVILREEPPVLWLAVEGVTPPPQHLVAKPALQEKKPRFVLTPWREP